MIFESRNIQKNVLLQYKKLEQLSKLGMQCRADEKVWQRVWSEEEKLNFASTPLFLLRAEKLS